MAIYLKAGNQPIIVSSVKIDPGCYVNGKIVRFYATLEQLQSFDVAQVTATGGPAEIEAVLEAAAHPCRAVRPLADLERDAILQAVSLFAHRWEAAKALRIGQTTLYRKLREYEAAARNQNDPKTSRRKDR